MAYISTEDVKHIRNTLKKELPQYKFSVVRDHHSRVSINLMKGPAFKDFEYFDKYSGETKVGTLNDHSWFRPESAIFCVDKQEYHQVPEDIPHYERLP